MNMREVLIDIYLSLKYKLNEVLVTDCFKKGTISPWGV